MASVARVASLMLGLSAALSTALAAQGAVPMPNSARPPFPLGEALEYEVRVAVGGAVGKGQMRVEGPVMEAGHSVWKLIFELDAGRGPVRASDRTISWFDPVRFASVRYEKVERHPLSRGEEHVVMNAAAGTWRDDEGETHRLGSTLPLDELSFIYFLRTLPLGRDTTFRFERHYDPERNPTIVQVKGTEIVETRVGIFRTRVVEMQVRDPKRYRGQGVIRFNIDVAGCHVPVRIQSSMPILGATTLTLTGWVSPPRYPGAFTCE